MFLLLALCVALPLSSVRAQDVLDQVPADALAFVIVRDMASVRQQMSRFTDPNAPNPLVDLFPESLINAAIGNNPGLDARGDLLFVARASNRPLLESPLSVWLPVRNYEAFVRALKGNPQDRIAVITVQGQDMLCARQDRWALIMDAGERDRLDAMLNDKPTVPPRVAAWRETFTKNPISVGVLPTDASRQAIRDWLGPAQAADIAANGGTNQQPVEPFPSPFSNSPAKPAFHTQIVKLAADSPKLSALVLDASAVAAGIRIENGSLAATLRLAWPESEREPSKITAVAPTLHREGEFTFSGSGVFPESLCRAVIESVARSSLRELRSDNVRRTFDPVLIDRFLTESESAAALVRGASIFHLPGGDQDGVYTNHFLALRVESASSFSAQVSRVCDAWNNLNQRAQPTSNLAFERSESKIAGKLTVDYSLDILAADELRDEPSMRQLMVRLFGPDRKLHRYVVQADDHTVLLAGATADQVTSALKFLKDSAPSTWRATNTAITNQLAPEAADWKLFFSPAGYVKWLKRAEDVNFGEVVGAAPIDPFPATPPVVLSGTFPKNEMTLELAVPRDTLGNAQAYRLLRSRRVRAAQ
jgi:hypothetical protein